MQALCQWEAQHDTSPESLAEFFVDREASSAATRHATGLVQAFWQRHKRIDKAIAAGAEKWALARISLVERNIMRVAVVELTEEEVPPKVAINEAIEIGREFGGEDSPRFINGVLDKIMKSKSEGRG
jgi:N utilization substance protein B